MGKLGQAILKYTLIVAALAAIGFWSTINDDDTPPTTAIATEGH